jgi:transposase
MQTIFHNCCGLDVHKESIVACIIKTPKHLMNSSNNERVEKDIRIFETFSDNLMELRTWLEAEDCHHVAMESTGVYWFPVYEVLEKAFEGDIEILVVNAAHMKNVPGKKTDIKDAEWIASLLRAGLLRGSFIPPHDIRELRELTRYRKTIVQDICVQKNRIEKSLQMHGVKLSTFLTDVFGVSGRNLLLVLIKNGKLTRSDIESETRQISIEKKSEMKRTLNVHLTKQQCNFLKMQLEYLDEQLVHLETIESSIIELSDSFQTEIERLDTIPGIATTAATSIIAEIGTDMDKFPTAEHFCSWAGLSPGNNESAGKKKTLESPTGIPI